MGSSLLAWARNHFLDHNKLQGSNLWVCLFNGSYHTLFYDKLAWDSKPNWHGWLWISLSWKFVFYAYLKTKACINSIKHFLLAMGIGFKLQMRCLKKLFDRCLLYESWIFEIVSVMKMIIWIEDRLFVGQDHVIFSWNILVHSNFLDDEKVQLFNWIHQKNILSDNDLQDGKMWLLPLAIGTDPLCSICSS